MMTLRLFGGNPPDVPVSTTWLVGELGEALGKQELFTRQAPQRLKALREHAISRARYRPTASRASRSTARRRDAVSSVGPGSSGGPQTKTEVRGYRDALRTHP